MSSTYTIVVGNIGTVYKGTDEDAARQTFNEYCKLSEGGVGRAADETVTLFKDDEVFDAYMSPAAEAEMARLGRENPLPDDRFERLTRRIANVFGWDEDKIAELLSAHKKEQP